MTEWRWIDGFTGYEISNDGQVRSYRPANGHGPLSTIPVRILKLKTDKDGYHQVGMMRDGKVIWRHVHGLVAEAFIGPRPEGQVVRHKTSNLQDNRVESLEYGTYEQNNGEDKRRDGTAMLGARNHKTKLSEDDVRSIRADYPAHTAREIAEHFGITHSNVLAIIHRKTWQHVS